MNKKVKIGSRGGTITITDKNYKAAGGEASIYVNGGKLFKIYHDQNKTLPARKIQELSLIYNPQVIVPQDLIFDVTTGDPLGYTADYIDNVEPLLKLFTRTFKQDNNLDPQMIAALVKQLQLITNDIHGAHCLIVDFNELNVLVNLAPNLLTPYFIDVDSYQTPSFKATAIMDSVRDRRVTAHDNNGKLIYNADIMSDWFSWAILSFWLYTNIHPFRGGHPNYRPCDKQKQMDDGISVFHRGVKVPPSVNNFNVIPKRHLDWYQSVFLRNERSVPPLPDSMAPLTVPAAIITIKGNNQVDVIQIAAYSENVVSVIQSMGLNYVVTTKKVYCDQKELMNGRERVKKTVLCPASDGTIIVGSLLGNKVTFNELHRQREIGTIASQDIFVRNNCVYTVSGNGKFVENFFTAMGDKIIHRVNEIENVSIYTTTACNGCLIQDLLGKKHLTLPYKKGSCFSKYLPQLDQYRIVDAKAERNVVVIIAEKGGQYDRFIIVFKKDYSDFDVRKVEDIAYDTINFTVLENGLCILLANPDELELFGNNQNVSVLQDPPFDSTMKLFNTPDGAFFINGDTIHQIKRK
jgi:hypothetical protein